MSDSLLEQVEKSVVVNGAVEDKKDYRDLNYEEIVGAVDVPNKYSLKEKQTPVKNQGTRGTCHSADTEVLTDKGWLLFKDLKGGELLATVNRETFELEYQLPEELIKLKYEGGMYSVENNYLNFCVSSDHRMFLEELEDDTGAYKGYVFKKISDIDKHSILLEAPKMWRGRRISEIFGYSGEDYMRFMAIFLACGGIKHGKNACFDISIEMDLLSENFMFGIEAMSGVLKRMNFVQNKEDLSVFSFKNKDLSDHLYTFLGSGGNKKFVPNTIKNASESQIRLFLKWFRKVDRYPLNKKMADDLQELYLKIGVNVSIYKFGQEYVVNFPNEKEIFDLYKDEIVITPYNGYVYCATVPNSTLITRRFGKTLISGNCVAFGATSVLEFFEKNSKNSNSIDLSEEYLFKRIKEIDVQDSGYDGYGASLRSGAKACQKYGTCLETTKPYQPKGGEGYWKTWAPIPDLDKEAEGYRILSYSSVRPSKEMIQQSLIATETPLIAGFALYSSYRKSMSNGGIVPKPTTADKYVAGHCNSIVGYNEDYLILKNSWSDKWGDGGYLYWSWDCLDKVYSIWSFIDVVNNPHIIKENLIEYYKKFVSNYALKSWEKGLSIGVLSENSKPLDNVTKQDFVVLCDRLGLLK